MIGEQIGRYEITALIGEGGMGKVFSARDTESGDQVAVKMLVPKYSKVETIVRRFFNEAKAAGATHHPGIVDVYESGFCGDRAYMALELIKGEALGDLLHREKKMSTPDVIDVGTQIALALAAAHDKGIVHRDLKPDNIMLIEDIEAPRGLRVKILDFGLAKLLDDLGQATVRTNTGVTMGTPSYMAPEQWKAERSIDHRADIYGLGCVLFNMALGRPPFLYEGFAAKMRAHLREEPPDPRLIDDQIPDSLAELLLNLLEKDPAARYQTMVDVAAALDAVRRGVELPAAPRRAATADITGGKGKPKALAPTVSDESLHPSMPPQPSLIDDVRTKLPLLLIMVLATAVVGGIVVWRLLAA